MSDCGACLSSPEDGCIDVLFEKVVTARKPAKCCECSRIIEIGQQYHCVKGTYEGEFCVYRTCAICLEIRTAFACNGFNFMALWEDLEYSFDELNDGCFAKLQTVDAKKYLRERWMKWKGLAA